MVEILKDCSPESMCKGLHQAMCTIIRYYGDSPYYHMKETSEYLLFSHGVNFPAYQGVTNFRAPTEVWDEKIEEVISWFRERSLPFMWMPSPDQDPGFEERLIEHGLQSGIPRGMSVDLNILPEKHENPTDLEIRMVRTPDEMEKFFEIWCTAYPMPNPLAETFCNATKSIDYTSGENACFFLGYLDGEPVATSKIFLGGGVAGLWWVTTLPSARGRGVGTAMTLKPLLLAREKGYRMATLQATDMGRPLYTKLGFQAPPQKTPYLWTPE